MPENAEQAVAILRARGVVDPVDVAVLLGFGLGGLAEGFGAAVSVDYAELPGFPRADGPGAPGRIVFSQLEGANVCFLSGQAHFFGSGDPAAMAGALATVKALGAKQLLIFSTGGSTKADIYPGNLAVITDHIALFGLNPLIGMADDASFLPLNEVYDPRGQRRLKRAASAAGVPLHEGVFMWLSGPTFATPAEARIARQLGADLIGFGVAPEVILARKFGLRVSAVVAASHVANGAQGAEPSLDEVQRNALAAGVSLRRLLRAYVKATETI